MLFAEPRRAASEAVRPANALGVFRLSGGRGAAHRTTGGHPPGEVCKQPIWGFWDDTCFFLYHLTSVPIIDPSVSRTTALHRHVCSVSQPTATLVTSVSPGSGPLPAWRHGACPLRDAFAPALCPLGGARRSTELLVGPC